MNSSGLSQAALPNALPSAQVKVGYGASFTDISSFDQSMARAQAGAPPGGLTMQATPAPAPGQALRALFQPLERINAEASRLSASADAAVKAGTELGPADMVRMSVKVHEFMFNCQLTSNAANRASDGLQQLFRQQS